MRKHPPARVSTTFLPVGRPTKFENNRYLGDKRSQVVYDLDLADTDPQVADAVQELLSAEAFAAFGPDTLAEARNRGYRPHKSIRRAEAPSDN
jgi:hypothetical protein